MSLKEAIKSEARRLGFNLIGVTSPDAPPHQEVYEAWIRKGRHGEMAYLATSRALERRANPRLILPECRSILVLGIPYFPPGRHKEGRVDLDYPRGLSGQVAAYAWGDDYHVVLPERLKTLVILIEARVGHPVANRCYTDTGPILERDLAQRAGLGWIGKNTCLINPEWGSYFLLAEILLDIELEPDQPFLSDRCGSCTRCLEACPTQCILPDRTLDARRCISYLTIELKGAVPRDLRPLVGAWVFGCDVCQQVCPWNLRFAPPEGDRAFTPRPGIPTPDLVKELSLTPQEFNHKFKGSAVKRTKRRGYLRNIAVALGNRKGASAVAVLTRALQDEGPLVRAHAAWALGQIGDERARDRLQAAAQVEEDAAVLEEIYLALGD